MSLPKMSENRLTNVAVPEIAEQPPRREMRQLADKQIERPGEQRIQILHRAEVCAVPDSQAASFNQEGIRRVITRILCLKGTAQSIEMGCSKGCYLHGTVLDGPPVFERLEDQFELEEFVEKIGGSQHPAQGRDAVRRQADPQWFLPPSEPETLEQHEKATDVIAVQMRDENLIDGVTVEPQRLKAPADRLTAIHQQRGAADAVKIGRMIPIRASHAVAHAEAFQEK
jgi:hypothetical protein